jgi:hypothetical protein
LPTKSRIQTRRVKQARFLQKKSIAQLYGPQTRQRNKEEYNNPQPTTLIHSRSLQQRHPFPGQYSIGRVGQYSIGANIAQSFG